MKLLIDQLKQQYIEARNALRFSKMMDANERSNWNEQRMKAGKKLETYGVNLNEL